MVHGIIYGIIALSHVTRRYIFIYPLTCVYSVAESLRIRSNDEFNDLVKRACTVWGVEAFMNTKMCRWKYLCLLMETRPGEFGDDIGVCGKCDNCLNASYTPALQLNRREQPSGYVYVYTMHAS
jgi:hypothetical protein